MIIFSIGFSAPSLAQEENLTWENMLELFSTGCFAPFMAREGKSGAGYNKGR